MFTKNGGHRWSTSRSNRQNTVFSMQILCALIMTNNLFRQFDHFIGHRWSPSVAKRMIMSYYHQIDGQRVDHSSRCPFGDRYVYRKYNVLAKAHNTMATVTDGVGRPDIYCVSIASSQCSAAHLCGQSHGTPY